METSRRKRIALRQSETGGATIVAQRRLRQLSADFLVALLVLGSGFLVWQRLSSAPAEFEMASLTIATPDVGVGLEDVRITTHLNSGDLADGRLSDLVPEPGAGCTLLIFFSPICPICHSIAPDWAAVGEIQRGRQRIAVHWVSIQPWLSAENLRFVDAYFLPDPWTSIPTSEESASIGVDRWPLLYLVDSERRFLGSMPRAPEDYSEELIVTAAGDACQVDRL